ncbi:hypothetical protein V2J09_004964 [Rumex salicifolius]
MGVDCMIRVIAIIFQLKKMEKQRSFSLKSTKCLFFSLTLSFSLFLLSFMFFWVMKEATGASTTVHVETYLKLERKLPGELAHIERVDMKPLVVSSANFSENDVRSSNLMQTLFRMPQNSSGYVRDLDLVEAKRGKGETEEIMDGENSVDLEDDSEAEAPESEEIQEEQHIEIDDSNGHNENLSSSSAEPEIPIAEKIAVKTSRFCDVSRGRWVFDESYPLYTKSSCPFIDEGFNCKGNGRLDNDYMKWRWQPQDCDIPRLDVAKYMGLIDRFNATKMLEAIRGKRLVFVGDSINRNQWESMLCMLMGALKDPKKVYETHGRKITKERGSYSFRFVDYQCTVEFYVTHFLVHESKARIGNKRVPTLRIDSIDRGSSRWRGADVLIFNTANWWSHSKTKAGITLLTQDHVNSANYYQEGKLVHPKMDVLTAFRRALTTWATWVDRHVNRGRTRVFFRSAAPSHFRGGEWNTGGHCREAKKPLNVSYKTESEKDRIATEVIGNMKTRVTFLNVTTLSGYRIDGHPSIYGTKSRRRVEDCSHWCLPGVPDAWNEMLYYHLLSEQETTSSSPSPPSLSVSLDVSPPSHSPSPSLSPDVSSPSPRLFSSHPCSRVSLPPPPSSPSPRVPSPSVSNSLPSSSPSPGVPSPSVFVSLSSSSPSPRVPSPFGYVSLPSPSPSLHLPYPRVPCDKITKDNNLVRYILSLF